MTNTALPKSDDYIRGLNTAISEVMEWRELTLRAYESRKYTDPSEARIECQNTLNLLDMIISKLRQKAGEDKQTVWREMSELKQVGYP